MTYECFALYIFPQLSILHTLRGHGLISAQLNLDPRPGKWLSLAFGWVGFGLMVVGLLYVGRKRVPFLKNFGSMSDWLNFHIFCGLMGPALIVLHTGFKVGGLAAIAFWSMMISFVSGIVGRYFYLQVARQKADLDRDVRSSERALEKLQAGLPHLISIEKLAELKNSVLAQAGAAVAVGQHAMGFFTPLLATVTGDLRLHWGLGRMTRQLPGRARAELRKYAIMTRRSHLFEAFRRIMGYWHSFHAPFALLMYAVAIIHIVAALMFKSPT